MKRFLIVFLLAFIGLYGKAQTAYEFADMEDGTECSCFALAQNSPNPFNATTDVYLTVGDGGEVTLIVADVSGHVEATFTSTLERGTHLFRVTVATKGTHLMAALQGGNRSSIVMVCNEGGGENKIVYS